MKKLGNMKTKLYSAKPGVKKQPTVGQKMKKVDKIAKPKRLKVPNITIKE